MCPLCLARARVPTNSRQLTPSYPMQVGTGRSDLEAFEDTLTDAHHPKVLVRYHYSLGSHKSHMRMGGKSSKKRSLRTIFPTPNAPSARDQPAIRFGFPAVALPWSLKSANAHELSLRSRLLSRTKKIADALVSESCERLLALHTVGSRCRPRSTIHFEGVKLANVTCGCLCCECPLE